MIRSFKHIFKKQKVGGIVLMYHRIDKPLNDPWDLAVSPQNFEDQLKFLTTNYNVIPTHELAHRLRSNKNIDDVVAITFDDGYLDNYTTAKPILEKVKVPATFYFTTQFDPTQFWWDTLEELILNSFDLPAAFIVDLGTETITFELKGASQLTPEIRKQNNAWRYGDPLVNGRLKLYFELWSRIKTMSIPYQKKWIEAIKSTCGINNVSTPPLMNLEQLKELAKVSSFEIGAHTVNHPALGSLDEAHQEEEIRQSKNVLEEIIGKEITGFAYPYGHYNEITPDLVQKYGFSYAVTTEPRVAQNEDKPFEIPRFQVKNVNATVFEKELKQWKRG